MSDGAYSRRDLRDMSPSPVLSSGEAGSSLLGHGCVSGITRPSRARRGFGARGSGARWVLGRLGIPPGLPELLGRGGDFAPEAEGRVGSSCASRAFVELCACWATFFTGPARSGLVAEVACRGLLGLFQNHGSIRYP